MADKRRNILAQAINYLKSNFPKLDYDFLSQILDFEPNVTLESSDPRDLKVLFNSLKLPAHQPFKDALSQLMAPKRKTVEALKRNIRALSENLRDSDNEDESDDKKVKKSKKRLLSPVIMTQSFPAEEKKKKDSDPQKKKRRRITCDEDESFSDFANLMYCLNWKKQLKWWRPFEKSDKIMVFCYCDKDALISRNQFTKRNEFICKIAEFKKRCGLQLNQKSASKLMSFLEENEFSEIPRPRCNCDDNSICHIRGSPPTADEHQLYFFCPNCKSCYLFKDEMKPLLKAINKKIEKTQSEPEEDDGSTSSDE